MGVELSQQLYEIIRKIVQEEFLHQTQEASGYKERTEQFPGVITFSNPIIIKKFGWLICKASIQKLHELLLSNGFILCEYKMFMLHFTGAEQSVEKITWLANLNELTYLFTRIREEGVIPNHRFPHKLLQENFLDKYQEPLNANSLRTLLEKGVANHRRVELIEKIIAAILNDTDIAKN